MIIARLERDGETMLLFVLEPGNFAKLQEGKPLVKNLGDFLPGATGKIVLTYTPDVEWVISQLVQNGGDFSAAIELSLRRKPIFRSDADEVGKVNKWKEKK